MRQTIIETGAAWAPREPDDMKTAAQRKAFYAAQRRQRAEAWQAVWLWAVSIPVAAMVAYAIGVGASL